MRKLAIFFTLFLLITASLSLGAENRLIVALPEEPDQSMILEIFCSDPALPADHSVDAGPYIMKEWKRNDSIVLEANEDYEGRPPAIDRIVLKIVPDEQARIMLLQKGEIDAIETMDTLIGQIPGIRQHTTNVNHPASQDPRSHGERGDRIWTILATYQIPNGSSGLAWDGTYLYSGIYGANGDQIYQIDPSDGSYSLLFTGPQGDAFGLTYDGTYLWTTDHPGSSSVPAVAMQMDWAGGPLASFNLPDHYMSGIAYDGGDFWVATYYPDSPATIYLVDNTGFVKDQFDAPDNQPWDLCMENGYLWMADYYGDTLYKIDPTTGSTVDSHASEYVDPAGIVYDGTYLWYCDEGTGGFDNLYKVDLLGTGTPDINVPTTYHDFGVVTIGDSDTWNVTVQNVGNEDLVVSGVTFTSTDLSTTATFPMTINPSNQDTIPVTYQPTTIGELLATATIASNDPIDPTVDLTIDGHGVAPGPEINLPESGHDYGAIRIYSSKKWRMEIENLGDTTLTISSIVSDDSHFSLDPVHTFPMDIAVLGSAEIGVWFQTNTAVSQSGTLTITSNDGDESPLYVTVEGSGTDTAQPIGTTLWSYLIDVSYDNSPKAMSHILDINGDGLDDVIIASEDNYVRCFNGASSGTGDVIWELEIYSGNLYHQNDLDVIDDIDDDGYEDIVVGTTGGDRSIHMISGKTGQIIWTHDTDEYGDGGWVYQVDCRYDYNDDGIPDVLASTGDDSGDTGPKRVYCLNGTNGVSIWEVPLGGPVFSVIGVENFTGDGKPDVIAGASNEGETQGAVFGISGGPGTLYWNQPFYPAGTSVWALAQIDDITSDTLKDLLIGDFAFAGGNYYGLNSTNGSQQYSLSNGSDLVLRFEELEDVNSDGHPDMAAGHAGISAKVIDPYAGSFAWTHALADKSWNVARIPDVNDDGINDLAVGTLFSNNYCYFLDGTNGAEIHSVNYGTPLDSLTTIPDVVGDGSWEIIAGGRSGLASCISGGTAVAPNSAPGSPTIEGPSHAKPGSVCRFTIRAVDKEESSLQYFVRWGDGQDSGWIGPFRSGDEVEVAHTWTTRGVYRIRAKAEDPFGLTSGWSGIHEIKISVLATDWVKESPGDSAHFEGAGLETELP